MQNGSVTTPFGRRPMSLALVLRQVATAEIAPGKTADKWKVFRDASEARELLGLQDRSLAVLDALLSFYPDNELRQDAQLIVFPSNAQLTLRAHGIAGATLRRHLALLVEAGLIVRKDSANGKRYARKDRTGEIENAFGFDISPLLLRAEELAGMAQKVAADRLAFRRAKESLTICRRDVRKLITAAIEEGVAGNWAMIEDVYTRLVGHIPRSPTMSEVAGILEEMELLRNEIVNLLENQQKATKNSTNDAHIERHIQSSNPESIYELEPSSRKELGAMPERKSRLHSETMRTFPLGLVLKACPEITAYGPNGAIGNWRELMSAAVVVRSMLGVSPSAYQEACETMGAENAATTVACILERSGHINSAGAYLRDLTMKAKRGEFSVGPAIIALLRANGHGDYVTGKAS
ncbi:MULTISPECIES: plasmid replication protein RepC [Rhizobium]|uniref:Replication initiation protein RepC n=1 Tax=Rhizobium tropici TaxID=398 RepID=A0A329YGY1_RHITR|nr:MULTISPECIES: plasmid replication protein RepC [Rhizobium]MBB3290918.1 replication initiation protein RepC [Rhizobium sp. BK252]MBB3405698.1 replication initiation protein RepC [Rhizobium sp. BK289]MBB3418245.1 replication initiation protein RepC [Rhizobium sp. BK284]MBB3486073.1 replication initiation protein RepC [Rhizobium sp. BK347]MDK4723851.1 plasmid replication protein RepC [Rhizobium sp. CNPSo 3968]